jgi:hypothetical protein
MTPITVLFLSFATLGDPGGSGGARLEPEDFVVQGTDEVAEDGWSYEVRPYVWFPALDVSAMVGGVTSGTTSKNFSGLFKDLEPSLMVAVEAAPPSADWSVGIDLSYIDTSVERDALSVETMQTFVEVDAFIATPDLPGTDVYVGLRFVHIDTTVSTGAARGSDDDLLVDPLIGARVALPLGEKLVAHAAGSLGGFGFGTDLTWHINLGLEYPLGDCGGALDVAWRFLDVDYDDSFELDARYSGPMLGLVWGF